MSYKFNVGDSVEMLDGPEKSKSLGLSYKVLWYEAMMRELIGRTGVVQRIDDNASRVRYVVLFEGSEYEWYCYEEWLAPVQYLTQSSELDNLFAQM